MADFKIETTATFDRGMKEALKRETHGIPEFEVIADIIKNGLNLPAGRNLEKLYDREDGPVYSVRIDAGRRMTIQPLAKKRNVIRLRAVGEHDPTYDKDRAMK